MIPEQELRQMYHGDNMTQIEIAEVFGVSQMTISTQMKTYGIKSRTNSESKLGVLRPTNPLKPSKKYLKETYINNQMSIYEIADEIGVSNGTILRWMQEYEIESRTISESLVGKYTGEKSSGWKGGISFEPYCKRFNNEFKESVRMRDDYTCQLCGYEQLPGGQKLDVHHIHYDKENCYPDVVALCRSCHGRVGGNREYWEQYFENQLSERGLTCRSISQEIENA